jgi:hypothetical protein
LHQDFLLALFGDECVDDVLWQLACLPMKKAGLAIPNLMATVESNWMASMVICGHLVVAIRGGEEFRYMDHQHIWETGIAEMKKRQLKTSNETL